MEDQMVAYERRLSDIKTLMPEYGVIGYASDDGGMSPEFSWTQYYLAPLVLTDSAEPQLVVLNRHDYNAQDHHQDGTYIMEERSGIKLYDFGTGIYLEDRRAMH